MHSSIFLNVTWLLLAVFGVAMGCTCFIPLNKSCLCVTAFLVWFVHQSIFLEVVLFPFLAWISWSSDNLILCPTLLLEKSRDLNDIHSYLAFFVFEFKPLASVTSKKHSHAFTDNIQGIWVGTRLFLAPENRKSWIGELFGHLCWNFTSMGGWLAVGWFESL